MLITRAKEAATVHHAPCYTVLAQSAGANNRLAYSATSLTDACTMFYTHDAPLLAQRMLPINHDSGTKA